MNQEKTKALCHADAIEAMLERWGGILQPLFIEDLQGAVYELRSLTNSVQDLKLARDAAIERSQKLLDAKQHWLEKCGSLQAELVAEAARTAEQKLRADQMTQQHAEQAAMNRQARKELASLHVQTPLSIERINELEAQAGLDHYELVRLVERDYAAARQQTQRELDELKAKTVRIGLDVDSALRGQVNESSPIASRLKMLASLQSQKP